MKKLLSIVLALSLILTFNFTSDIVVTADPANWYVDDSGSDITGDGSSSNPWATIQYAVDNASPGDTINVAAGTYAETVYIDRALTITGAGDTTVIQPTQEDIDVIGFSYVVPDYYGSGSDLKLAGAIVINGTSTPDSAVTLQNLKTDLSGITTLPADAEVLCNILYRDSNGDIDNVTAVGLNTPVATKNTCIFCFCFGATGADVEIENCDISGYTYSGIECSQVHLSADIHNNTITGLNSSAVDTAGIVISNGVHANISGNTIEKNSYESLGLYISSTDEVDILNNTLNDNGYGIWINNCSDITIGSNIITNTTDYGNDQWGILIEHSGNYTVNGNTVSYTYTVSASDNVYGINITEDDVSMTDTITTNTVSGGEYGISLYHSYDNNLTGNNIHDNLLGISIYASDSNTLTGNNIHDNETGIHLEYSDSNALTGNNIHDNDTGIILGDESDTNTVEQNTIAENLAGIWIETALLTNPGNTIKYNDIYDNTNYGVVNDDDYTLDVRYNWWGDISGPEQATTNPGGTGDIFDGNINYQPWITENYQTVVGDDIAYFGYAMVELDAGWNIFSTPIALHEDCDTWGEFIAMGDGLNVAIGYEYNGETDRWVVLTADSLISPGKAYYVKMNTSDITAICYSGNLSTPTTELYGGWNLVGLMRLQDMDLKEALSSAYIVVGDLVGYSIVISPSVGNQTAWLYMRDGATPPDMETTKGYWVYMVNAGTLGGFEFTPVNLP